MLHKIYLDNLGKFSSSSYSLSSRLNIIIGEKESGKSLLLNAVWWALTEVWPQDINPHVISGRRINPLRYTTNVPQIRLTTSRDKAIKSTFIRKQQAWSTIRDSSNDCIVFYAMSQGCFGLFDPIKKKLGANSTLVMTPKDVFDGVISKDKKVFCEGMVQDWSSWQKGNGDEYLALKNNLLNMGLKNGPLVRIDLSDIRDFPTYCVSNKMESRAETPIAFASTSTQRLLSLAYLATWAIRENKIAAKFGNVKPTKKVIFLIDDVETNFSFSIRYSFINRLFRLFDDLNVKMIATKHSQFALNEDNTQNSKEYNLITLDN